MIILESPRVRLRPFRADDADAYFALRSDPRVMRYWSGAPFTSRDQAEAAIATYLQPSDILFWALADRPSDTLIGNVTLFELNREHLRCELGYSLAPAWQGRGLAQEAARLALTHAFDALGLERIEADIDPRNTASRVLATRLGFKLEGHLRGKWRVAGEVCDTSLYGLLRADFRR